MAYANFHATGQNPTNDFSGGRKTPCFNTYEKLHNGSIDKPICDDKSIVLDKIDDRENKIGFRHYKKN